MSDGLMRSLRADMNVQPHNGGALPRSQVKKSKTIHRRKSYTDGFTTIPKYLLDEKSLSWKAKGILCYLLSKPEDWKARVKDIQEHGREGRESIENALKELRKSGYAQLVKVVDERGRVLEWKWNVNDQPIYPETGFPEVEKPELVNPSLTNTECNNKEVTNKEFASTAVDVDPTDAAVESFITENELFHVATKRGEIAGVLRRKKKPIRDWRKYLLSLDSLLSGGGI